MDETVRIQIEEYRTDPGQCHWELPAWGHPLSQGIMPLLITVDGRLIPIGTAFTVGQGVPLVISAAHNIREVFKHEERLSHLITAASLPAAIALKEVGLAVLHQSRCDEGEGIEYTIWPLETFSGASPTDVVFGFLQVQPGIRTLSCPMSFDVPARNQRICSVGYTDFKFPDGGIELEKIKDGSFNWRSDYSHRFVAVEGHVDRIFIRRFASGYIEGPCFTFDAEIFHGQSGGPVFDANGFVRGVNSASATSFFSRPTTIASFMHPILLKEICVKFGPLPLTVNKQFIDWIAQGIIETDGSEERVSFYTTENSVKAGLSAPEEFDEFIHDDFRGFQDGISATLETGESYRIRTNALTPQPIYEQCLLHVLATQFKGKGDKHEVTKAVLAAMRARGFLSSADMQRVSTGETKAENTVAWARNALKERGLISRASQRGKWELTPQGLKDGLGTSLPQRV